MKLVLGLLVCCILAIVGTVILAPEYAHEIIDRFHDKPTTHTTKPQVTESDNENDDSEGTMDDISNRPVTTTIITKTVNDTPIVAKPLVATPVYTTPIEHPLTKKEMLEWLRTNGYCTAIGNLDHCLNQDCDIITI